MVGGAGHLAVGATGLLPASPPGPLAAPAPQPGRHGGCDYTADVSLSPCCHHVLSELGNLDGLYQCEFNGTCFKTMLAFCVFVYMQFLEDYQYHKCTLNFPKLFPT